MLPLQLPVSLQHLLNSFFNGPARYTQRHHFGPELALVFVLGIFFAEAVAVYVVVHGIFALLRNIPALFKLTLRKFGVGEKEIPRTFLELTFPADTTKSAYATEQLHILLKGMVKYYGFRDGLAAWKKPYSLELVGTNDDGIRYVLLIPTREVDTVQHDLISFLPGLKVRQIKDYVPPVENTDITIIELRLNGDFVLPLKGHKTLEEHDLMAFLTGHMTKLAPDELVAFQIVAVPVFSGTHHRVVRRKRKIISRIAHGKEVSSCLEAQRSSTGYLFWLLWYPPLWFIAAVAKLVAGLGSIVAFFLSSDHELPGFMNGNRDKRRPDDPYELELGTSMKEKLDQHLYEVTIRVLVVSPNAATRDRRTDAIVSSFRPFGTAYQSIGVRQDIPFLANSKYHLERFKARVLSPHHLSQQTILSSSELTDLYHFPNTDMVKTEGFVKSRSRELAAPLSIRHSEAKLDVIIGVNKHGGEEQQIGTTLQQRERHTYVIGKTGTGKTTLLKSAIYQDMMSGKGLAVLDPHGDMFKELLSIVPKHRRNDVVVFNPADWDFPIGLNILDPGITFGSEREKQKRITSNVLAVFAKLADKNQWGPRMEHILRNTTMTALQLPNPNLFTLQRLLTDRKYQREVAKTLKDPFLKEFWDKEFKLMGSMQMSTATAPLTNRLGHFITSVMSRHILLQEKSTLQISEIMNEGKILLVNLSKGGIGEDESKFFGIILTSFIWMAAYQRDQIPEEERRDFFLYVDEFQNFATPSFGEIASEGRKYHVPLVVSHQNIAQIEDKDLLKSVVANAHTIICLKASPDDEAFILPYMAPAVEKGDTVNLTPYHFFMKTTADESEDAFSGVTVPLDIEESKVTKEAVIAASRQQYATPVKQVEEYLEGLFGVNEVKKPRRQDTTRDGSKKSMDQNGNKGGNDKAAEKGDGTKGGNLSGLGDYDKGGSDNLVGM